jgi:hypothetical protein
MRLSDDLLLVVLRIFRAYEVSYLAGSVLSVSAIIYRVR